MLIQGQVGPSGPQSTQPGTTPAVRLGQLNDVIVSELHGRFYEQAYRGAFFSFGMTLTALVSANATATGVTATAQPVLGLWNPLNSTVNCVMTQAQLNCVANNLTSGAGPGAFVWLVQYAQGAITTGSTPFNRKTLTQVGSQAKAFEIGRAHI